MAKPMSSADPAMKVPPGTALSSEHGGEYPSAAQGCAKTTSVNIDCAICRRPPCSKTSSVMAYEPTNEGVKETRNAPGFGSRLRYLPVESWTFQKTDMALPSGSELSAADKYTVDRGVGASSGGIVGAYG